MEGMNQNDSEFVLAIDPALSTTGYAVINIDTLQLIEIGKITTSSSKAEDLRINEIVMHLFNTACHYPIKHIILEDGYLGANVKTGMQLATLRGAIIGVFNFNNYTVHHMLPSQIRKVFGCGGNAKKEQVAEAVTKMYHENEKLNEIGPYSDKQNKNKTSDIYDAISIGVAFCKFLKEGDSSG